MKKITKINILFQTKKDKKVKKHPHESTKQNIK